jgi:prevent-host-death family protein
MTIMVMKRITKRSSPASHERLRRLGVAEMKAHFSEALRALDAGPTIIHNRGHDVAVLIGIEHYDQLAASRAGEALGGRAFVEQVEALKRRFGGGVDDFEPPRLVLAPNEPFRSVRRRLK